MCSSVSSVLFPNRPFLLWIRTNRNIWIATMTSYVRSVIYGVCEKQSICRETNPVVSLPDCYYTIANTKNKKNKKQKKNPSVKKHFFCGTVARPALYVCIYTLKDCARFWIDEVNSDQTTLHGSNFWLITILSYFAVNNYVSFLFRATATKDRTILTTNKLPGTFSDLLSKKTCGNIFFVSFSLSFSFFWGKARPDIAVMIDWA